MCAIIWHHSSNIQAGVRQQFIPNMVRMSKIIQILLSCFSEGLALYCGQLSAKRWWQQWPMCQMSTAIVMDGSWAKAVEHTFLNGPNSPSILSNGQDIYRKTIPINAQYPETINNTMNYCPNEQYHVDFWLVENSPVTYLMELKIYTFACYELRQHVIKIEDLVVPFSKDFVNYNLSTIIPNWSK